MATKPPSKYQASVKVKQPLFKASTDNLDSGLWKHSQLGAGFINHPEFSVIHGGPQTSLGPDVSLNRRSSMGFLCSDTLVDAVPRGSSHVKQGGTSSPTFSGDGLQSSKSDGYEVSREETTESSEHVSPMGTDWSLLQGQKREQ